MGSTFPLFAPAGRRRRSVYFGLIALLVLLTIVFINEDSSYLPDLSAYIPKGLYLDQSTKHTTDAPKPTSNPHLEQVPEDVGDSNVLCEPDECMQGSWKPRHLPFRSYADFKRKYPPSHRGIIKFCGSDENKRDIEDRDKFRRAQEERLVQIMNWVWEPARGRMREWDTIEFVVRLLKSPGGLVFSGDSITRQQFQWLEYALARADVYITEDPPHLPFYSHNRLHQFILRPGNPMTTYLQARAGVPDSRLQRPIYTKIDNHVLIGEKEVREFTVPLGAKKDFRWLDQFGYFEGWEDFVREAARARGERGVTEDTILVLNTGAHWSRGSWYMLPNTGDTAEQQLRVSTVFKNMIDFVMSRLNAIPRLSIYYRATSPAHPACTSSTFYESFGMNSTSSTAQPGLFVNAQTSYTSPYPNISTAELAMSNIPDAVKSSTLDDHQRIVRSRWDWDRFAAHNTLWKDAINTHVRIQTSLDTAKWYYMDVWNMSLQRPDAHTQNFDSHHGYYDCLHWCVPGVVEQWMEYLNHLVFFNQSH